MHHVQRWQLFDVFTGMNYFYTKLLCYYITSILVYRLWKNKYLIYLIKIHNV